MTPEALAKELEAGTLRPAYLLAGDEPAERVILSPWPPEDWMSEAIPHQCIYAARIESGPRIR